MTPRFAFAVWAAGVAVAASSADAAEPFALEDVDFAPDCTPNPALGRLLSVIVPNYDNGLDGPVYDAVSGNVVQVLTFDDPASWHGLHLIEVRLFHGVERGPVNYTLAFDDEPAQVRSVWNARGWRFPAVGETREVEGLEGYASVGVEADEGLATVTCYRD